HELAVHPDLDVDRAQFGRRGQPGHQTGVLGHVVGGDADRVVPLQQDLAGRRLAHDRAIAGRTWVAPGATVGLDDDLQPAWLAHAAVTARTPRYVRGSAGTPRTVRPHPAQRPGPWHARNPPAPAGSPHTDRRAAARHRYRSTRGSSRTGRSGPWAGRPRAGPARTAATRAPSPRR